VQSTSQTPEGPLHLDVYPGENCHGSIYLDDGHSMRFESGDYLRQEIRCSSEGQSAVTVTFEPREGRHAPWWSRIEITVHHRSGPARISGSSGPLPSRYDPAASTIEFEIVDMPRGGTIRLQGQ
jgi:alpha-glucosidase